MSIQSSKPRSFLKLAEDGGIREVVANSNSPAPVTCLFTGSPLDPTTQPEHTILRAIGGRIRSQYVTSSEFNNACSFLDKELANSYAHLMSTLGPVLPYEFRRNSLDVNLLGNTDRKHALDDRGVLYQKDLTIVRDENGRPKSVAGHDQDRIRRILDRNRKSDKPPTVTWERRPDDFVYQCGQRIICVEIELAALKCAIVTFDDVCRTMPLRFTREPEIADVIAFVRDCVLTRELDPSTAARFSKGLQYSKLDAIRSMRHRVELEPQEFEHVLVASGDVATRTLDVVFHVLDTDPYGFRLSTNWRHCDFTCVVVNQVLRNGSTGTAWLHESSSIVRPTIGRAFQESDVSESKMKAFGQLIAENRNESHRRAIRYVEENAPDHLADCITEAAITDPDCNNSVHRAIQRRLKRAFEHRLTSDAKRSEFNAIVARWLATKPDNQVVIKSDAVGVDWPKWVEINRNCAQELEDQLGAPYLAFSINVEIGTDRVDIRKLGNPPERQQPPTGGVAGDVG